VLKLHIGCGNLRLGGYVNIDNRPIVSVDKILEAWDLKEFEDGSVGEIYSCHMLEHLERDELDRTVREWRRVLRRDGVLRLAVPDMRSIAMAILEGVSWNLHRRGWTFETLAEDLREWGFYDVKRWTAKEEWHDFNRAKIHTTNGGTIYVSLNVLALKI